MGPQIEVFTLANGRREGRGAVVHVMADETQLPPVAVSATQQSNAPKRSPRSHLSVAELLDSGGRWEGDAVPGFWRGMQGALLPGDRNTTHDPVNATASASTGTTSRAVFRLLPVP